MLSLATVLSLLGVTLFYLIVFCQRKKQPKIVPNASRTLAKKAALRKKKKEAKTTASSSKSKDSSLRNRGRRDDTGIDSDELSQSDVRTGTGSGTGTQSEVESDSQIELSSGEETSDCSDIF